MMIIPSPRLLFLREKYIALRQATKTTNMPCVHDRMMIHTRLTKSG
jgi:hypothetical protein